MTDAVTCPHCHEHLDIPAEFRGRPVRCGNCQTVFTPSAGDPPVVQRLPGRPSGRPVARARPLDDGDDDYDRRPPRRSNAGVVLLLFLTLFTVGGCCGGISLIGYLQTNPQFVTYTSPEGKFKVEFPAENPKQDPTVNPLDEKLEGVVVKADRVYGEEEYTVKSYPLHPAAEKLSPEEALKVIADAEVKLLNVPPEVKRDTNPDLKHGGFPAVDVMTGAGNGFAGQQGMMRVILAGKRVYVLSVTGQQVRPQHQNPQHWWQRQFFVSFEITDPPPKPEKKE